MGCHGNFTGTGMQYADCSSRLEAASATEIVPSRRHGTNRLALLLLGISTAHSKTALSRAISYTVLIQSRRLPYYLESPKLRILDSMQSTACTLRSTGHAAERDQKMTSSSRAAATSSPDGKIWAAEVPKSEVRAEAIVVEEAAAAAEAVVARAVAAAGYEMAATTVAETTSQPTWRLRPTRRRRPVPLPCIAARIRVLSERDAGCETWTRRHEACGI